MVRSGLPHCNALLAALALLLFAGAGQARAAAGMGGWDRPQQQAVQRSEIMAPLDDGAFHGERPLTAPQLRTSLHALADRLGVPAVATPTAGTVSVAGFDRLLITQLGLADVAGAVQSQAFRAGLEPPHRFGSEVVARLLALRDNHPAAVEWLELYPWQPVTRAEAAWSLALAMRFTGPEQQWARDVLARFVLPHYGERQRQALRIAVSKIGMPYIWGGETDTPTSFLGFQARGGYDCSGFAWRVFKLSGLPAGRHVFGRTAAQQAGAIGGPRLRLSQVRGGDLLFFGPGRFWMRATERRIVHEGIALSPDFMIHASAQGVYVSPLFEEWRAKEFSWARRVL